MKTILFPTDFSVSANNALNYALELAKITAARLILLNAYQLPYSRADMIVSVMDILKEDSEAGLKATLDKIKQNPKFDGIRCETISRVGDVVSVSSELIQDLEIDLIVMGTKGASGLIETIIGSNTAGVIKSVKCPVLAIPEKAFYSVPHKIGFAYDLKELENPKDLRFLAHLAKLFNAEIQIYSVIAEADQEAIDRSAVQLKLSEYFRGIKLEIYFVVNGDIIDGIMKLVKANQPDWVVMVAKKYRLFESLFHSSMTKSMVFQTKKPLLVLHNYKS